MTLKRPETFDDLQEYDRFETLASFELTDEAVKVGLLGAAQQVVDAYVRAYGPAHITVRVQYGAHMNLVCPRPEEELAKRLAAEQKRWDDKYAGSADASAGAAEVSQ